MTSGKSRNKVMGMAGILDTARYRAFLAEALNVSPKDIQAVLMGGHGDTMVPLPRYTTVGGIPVTELIDDSTLQAIVDRTKVGGGELVKTHGYFCMVCTRFCCRSNGRSDSKRSEKSIPCVHQP